MNGRNRIRISVARRALGALVASLFAIALSAFILAAPASAHVVTAIEADCTHVTVHFADFPEAGVMVHIAATVEGNATLATDELIANSATASLDISSATAALFGATVDVDVDVTWTFHGPQHVHQTLSVTCGTATTTTLRASTTTSTVAGGTTTTMANGSTSTTSAPGTSTTSTTELGGSTTTSVGAGGGATTSTTTGSSRSDTTGTTAVLGASVEAAGGVGTTPGTIAVLGASTTSTGSGLPFTGAATAPLVAVGVTVLAIGAAATSAARRKAHS